jgi:hypothetical protein
MHAIGESANLFSFSSLAYTVKAKITCQPCNNDFVSRFDHFASPILKRLFHRKQRLPLSEHSLKVLARWAMKMTLLIPYGIPEVGPTGIPAPLYTEFRHTGQPLGKRVKLFMARYAGTELASMGDVYSFPLSIPPNPHMPYGANLTAYTVTFCIQDLVFHAGGIDRVGFGVTPLPTEFTPFLFPIWPPHGGAVWPPSQILDTETLLRLGAVGFKPIPKPPGG